MLLTTLHASAQQWSSAAGIKGLLDLCGVGLDLTLCPRLLRRCSSLKVPPAGFAALTQLSSLELAGYSAPT